MTSLSSLSPGSSSPLQRLQSQLGAATQAGTVKAADATALSGALDSIDSSLKADRGGGTGGSGRSGPGGLKAKVDGLIDGQVSSGALTQDQAKELKSVFAAAGGARKAHGGHGAHGAGGPPPPPPSGDDQDDPTSATAAAASTTSASTSSDDLVEQFMQRLQDNLAGSYSQSGGVQKAASSLLLDVSA